MTLKKVFILLVALLALCAGVAIWWSSRTPHADDLGTTVIETDSTIITTTVTESKDSNGHVQYHTDRKVERKP